MTIGSEADSPNALPIFIDCLEQGEMARTIEQCGKDPGALLAFLDELLDLTEDREAAEAARERVSVNGSRIQDLEISTKQYDETKKVLDFKKRQQADAKAANSERLIDLQGQLARAISLRQNLLPTFQRLGIELITAFSGESSLADLEEQTRAAAQLAEQELEDPFPSIIETIRAAVKAGHDAVSEAIKLASPKVRDFVTLCEKRQAKLQLEIDSEVTKLRSKGIVLDLRFLSNLAADVIKLDQQLKRLERERHELTQLRAARVKLRTDFRQRKNKLYLKRRTLGEKLTSGLRNFLVDWDVSLTFGEGRFAPSAEAALKEVMEWRTSAVPKAPTLIGSLGVPDFLEALEQSKADKLQVKSRDGRLLISEGEAKVIVSRLSTWSLRRRLEESDYDDLPRLTVSRKAEELGGKVIVRDFANLSLGQRQSIVLAILLCVDNAFPLLIDQPEDNLDSAFIFQILVRALRGIKERRQVILVTHNANIAVLSDTDHIVPLKATATRGKVLSPGTLEQHATKEIVCEILEGGRSAYEMRGKLYGYPK